MSLQPKIGTLSQYRCVVVALIALVAAPVAAAASRPLIGNPDGRQTISLDGEWRTIIDPYDNGYQDYRSQPNKDGYFKNAKPQSPSDLIEYDFDRSPTLTVPGDWNSQRDSLLLYEGPIWYKTSFDHEPHDNSRLFVYFGAANYRALDRGVSRKSLSAPARIAWQAPLSQRCEPLDPGRFPLAPQASAWNSGLLESQEADLERGPEEEGVLRASVVLSIARSRRF